MSDVEDAQLGDAAAPGAPSPEQEAAIALSSGDDSESEGDDSESESEGTAGASNRSASADGRMSDGHAGAQSEGGAPSPSTLAVGSTPRALRRVTTGSSEILFMGLG